jgi:hypothetical protein
LVSAASGDCRESVDAERANLIMKKLTAMIISACFLASAAERSNYVFLNYALLFDAEASIGYQRIIEPKHAIGLLLRFRNFWGATFIPSISLFGNYDYYTKQSFHGFWLSPSTGVELDQFGITVPILAGIGYHWITPIGLSLGFNLAPGVNVLYQSKWPDRFLFAFLGVADIGYAF